MSASSIPHFTFQPEKVPTGIVYHYIKSNLDGSNPARVYIRMADDETLDVWKFEAHNADAAHVIAHMDWLSFSADRIQSWVVTSDGERQERATLTVSARNSSCTIRLGELSETVHVALMPVHLYNFDFISLGTTLSHWNNPRGAVEIGILQPNFDPNVNAVIRYDGTVVIRYAGEEERGGVFCRKYTIGGEGLQHQQGCIWLGNDLPHVVDMEIPVPDNPAWNSFKFRLVSVRSMLEGAWKSFIGGEIQKLDPV